MSAANGHDGAGDEFSEGFILPTLISQLKKILEQYPDDSQILKELIQNAEDARATCMRFLYDQREYGDQPTRLVAPSLAQFQGAAIYAYNDGVFDEKDWRGVRMLNQSIKQDDPLKVGYYGMGFKSVFHFTDLPSVLSGSRIGFIDPQQKYFPSSTCGWNLVSQRDQILKYEDQFQPYCGVFDSSEKVFEQGFYPATLFRFPLRTKPSLLSNVTYDQKRVQNLFDIFQRDTNMILLFLKYLEVIEVFDRGRYDFDPKLVYRVAIHPDYISEIRKQRESFLRKIKQCKWPQQPISTTYVFAVETIHISNDQEERHVHKWLLTNYYCGGHGNIRFRKLSEDPDLCFLPWVGAALPIKNDTASHEHDTPEVTSPTRRTFSKYKGCESEGRVFCFLPLPGEESCTGLPIHINGYFALEQNRKHIKWPIGVSRNGSDHSGKTLLWNQYMLSEALPVAYFNLITDAVERNKKGQSIIDIEAIYNAIPDMRKVDRKWQFVLAPFYSRILQSDIIYTEAKGGRWISVDNAIFADIKADDATRDVIFDIMKKANMNLAIVPEHIKVALNTQVDVRSSVVSAHLVSKAFKDLQNNSSFSYQDRMCVLRFITHGGHFDLIDRLQLLPLSHGGFTEFFYINKKKERTIFISHDDHNQDLLPGVEDRFLDNDVDEDIKSLLHKLAKRGYTQLRFLDKQAFEDLLPSCLSNKWCRTERILLSQIEDTVYNMVWFEKIWDYLRKHFPDDLSVIEGLTVVPVTIDGEEVVIKLHCGAAAVMAEFEGIVLESAVRTALSKIGVNVVDSLPRFVQHHPAILGHYFLSPTVGGVMKLLISMFEDSFDELLKLMEVHLSGEDRSQMRKFLSRATLSDLTKENTSFLSKLPIFEKLSAIKSPKSVEYTSVSQTNLAVSCDLPPVPISLSFLDLSSLNARNLASLLKINSITLTQLLRNIVFPDVESAFYDADELRKLMTFVLKQYYSCIQEDSDFTQTLRELAFLPKKDGLLVTPDRLYDPDSPLLQDLFLGEDNFPDDEYADASMLAVLREIGLRDSSCIDIYDLLFTAIEIDNMVKSGSLASEKLSRKVNSFVEYLSTETHYLEEIVDEKTLGEMLSGYCWVPRLHCKPYMYPTSLKWFEDDANYFKPNEIVTRDNCSLVGAVMPVMSTSLPPNFLHIFQWDELPPLTLIVQHLKIATNCYIAKEKGKYMSMVTNIYSAFCHYGCEQVANELQSQGIDDWIWHGDGFASLQNVVFDKTFTDLRPYIFSLPEEVESFSHLFTQFGVKRSADLLKVLQMIKLKNESHQSVPAIEIKRDLNICVSILNDLKSKLDQNELDEIRNELLLPLHDDNQTRLTLAPMHECTYCDTEWLRQGHDVADFENEEAIKFVHPNIPNATSESLGVPTLMSRMLDAEELDFSFGQSDSLTHRLNVLLQDYTDGFAIPKELLQNADDAGATELKILYDERQNRNARTFLIDEGMAECQGPALWAYNDAVFTDNDFENITKLSGATKESQIEKIGRFGLGFNAVYNITDVPSFVSRNNIVIFDPHTTHLGKGIKNKNKPGIKIDIKKHRKKLRRLRNQFKPYDDIFGCDLRPNSRQEAYEATLFRFPLRTRVQAMHSEISHRHYDDQEVKSLLNMLMKNANMMLLFTQNVMRVGIYHLPPKDTGRVFPVEIFHVSKGPIKIIRELAYTGELPDTVSDLPQEKQDFIRECNILRASTECIRSIKSGDLSVSEAQLPRSSMLIKIECYTSDGARKLMDKPNSFVSEDWLVCSVMGHGSALEMAVLEENLLPSGGVAVPISIQNRQAMQPLPITDAAGRHDGSVFTYLPLPIHSGLPVHINAAFAVTSSRRHLCERNEDDKFDIRALWNEYIMQDCICEAYFVMLQDLTALTSTPPYDFHELFPKLQYIESNSKPILMSLYRNLTLRNDLAIMHNGINWVTWGNSVFLDHAFKSSSIGQDAFHVFRQFSGNYGTAVELSTDIMQCLAASECTDLLEHKTFTMKDFYQNIFIPNCEHVVPQSRRDSLTVFALLQSDVDINALYSDSNCIPASNDGPVFRKPRELVDPSAYFADLFSDIDNKFPIGDSYAQPEVRIALRSLGMSYDALSWDDILERASVLKYQDKSVMIRNCALLLKTMANNLNMCEVDVDRNVTDELHETLLDIQFLPILKKPTNYHLPWKGEDFQCSGLLAPSQMYSHEHVNLVSCSEPVIDLETFPQKHSVLLNFLRINERKPSLQHILFQLDSLISYVEDNGTLTDANDLDSAEKICNSIYEEVQKQYIDDPEQGNGVIAELKTRTCILCKGQMVKCSKVAFEFPFHCVPYLFSVPEKFSHRFESLFRTLGVRGKFEIKDYVYALQEMQKNNAGHQLDEVSFQISLQLINLLNNDMTQSQMSLDEVVDSFGHIFIPDSTGMLQSASNLCFNEIECQWLPGDDNLNFSHHLIPFTISKQLGVNTKRQEMLRKHSKGIPFGQREKLTNRLKRILAGYPCDKEILKELLQNADDAGATEIHFVKDMRQHKDERVFDESWKPLQGPALCVYNDRPFTENDLEGIRNLGTGSKSSDPNKTGQYGVGFNCVYHLTDVPSFLTKGSDIGETLCIFDPHAKYVPGVTPDEPGRRYDNVEHLRKIFTDVFPCYLEDNFDMANATMFRFPLRNAQMVSSSELSDTQMTLEKVDILMNKFRQDLFECLLFVNNIKKISISEIYKGSNRLAKTYSVYANLSEEDTRKRDNFYNCIKNMSQEMKISKNDLSSFPVREISYQLALSDSNGLEDVWLVTQRVGFDDNTDIPYTVRDAFKNGELMLLPRGGAACLVSASKKPKGNVKRKAFCFLPLPVTTNLPVHVNGHFALDHETRRNLWRDEGGSPRTLWNSLLIKGVIAPAYVSLLQNVKMNLFQEGKVIYGPGCETKSSLQIFHQLFPAVTATDDYFSELAMHVYHFIKNNGIPLLSLVRPCDISVSDSDTYTALVEWFPLDQVGQRSVFFDNLKDIFIDDTNDNTDWIGMRSPRINQPQTFDRHNKKRHSLKKTLLLCGFNLLKTPESIFVHFEHSEIDVQRISPRAVIDFFQFHWEFRRKLPVYITETPFQNDRVLSVILAYCMQDGEYFSEKINRLPLLLLGDSSLSQFQTSDPKYVSSFMDLFPENASKFVHDSVTTKISCEPKYLSLDVFQPFTIDCVANLLHEVPYFQHVTPDDYISLDKKDGVSKEWITKIWSCIYEQCRVVIERGANLGVSEYRDFIFEFLKPLDTVPILPVYKTYKHSSGPVNVLLSPRSYGTTEFLIPVGEADSVIDFTNAGIMSYSVRESLRKLNVPELNCKVLDGGMLSPSKGNSKSDFLRKIVGSLDNPISVITVLKKLLSSPEKRMKNHLSVDESNLLLKYFNDSVDSWANDDNCLQIIKSFPFYLTVHGDLTGLYQDTVYIFPGDIPASDTNAWQRKDKIIFLKNNSSLERLYEALGCGYLSTTEVYNHFILKNFEYLSKESRVVHLRFLKDVKLPRLEEPDKTQLLSALKDLEFVADSEGNLKKASHFYDPQHHVFKVMFANDPSKYPSPPFQEYSWLDFMRSIGMIKDVPEDLYISFTEKVENLSQQSSPDITYHQSRAMVKELFSWNHITSTGLLDKISTKRFVPGVKVSPMLQRMHPQHNVAENSKAPCIAFCHSVPEYHEHLVWSSADILPNWANPLSQDPNTMQFECHVEHPFSTEMQYKEEIARQLNIWLNPPVSIVVQHVKNLCSNIRTETDDLSIFMKFDVLKKIYKFLQSQCFDDDFVHEELQNVPCIAVHQGDRFVFPHQVVIDIYDDEQLIPYLYKSPHELGEFHRLFQYLGATQTATPNQYAFVLEALFQDTSGQRLHPNELRIAFKAIHGLFKSLRNKSETLTVVELYLLSHQSTLIRSTELIFNNDLAYSERITDFTRSFLVDLKECNVRASNYEDVIKLLPESLQPQLLTDVVLEKLEDSSRRTIVPYGSAEKLKHQLTSISFSHAIVRLIKHEHHRSGQKVDQDMLETIQQRLHCIQVFSVESVITYLAYNGIRLDGSESENECFVERCKDMPENEDDEDEEMWNIYIQSSVRLNEELLVSVAEVVNRIIGGMLKNSVHYLQPILCCVPHMIPKVLDRLKIRPDHYGADIHEPTLPPPGSFIPLDDHHLLSEDFQEFDVGEYVAYEVDDPTIEEHVGNATFIYAIVMQKENNVESGTFTFTTAYKINVGDDRKPIIVAATDLYKFHRVDVITSPDTTAEMFDTSVGQNVYAAANTDEDSYISSPSTTTTTSPDKGSAGDDTSFNNFNQGHDPNLTTSTPKKDDGDSSSSIPQSPTENRHPHKADGKTKKERHRSARQSKTEDHTPAHLNKPFDDIKSEITDMLKEAWKLPENQRKKVIKRLLLKWHPDKNVGYEEISTKAVQHLNSEIERLENPQQHSQYEYQGNFSSFYEFFKEQMNNRARDHREHRQHYRETFHREYSSSSSARFNFDVPPSFHSTNPQPSEALRWLRQAEADHLSAFNDFSGEEPAYEWTCFKAHQASEKALKAVQYSVDAVVSSSHDLNTIVSSIDDVILKRLAGQLQNLVGDVTKLTYPDPIHYRTIPHESVMPEMASEAVALSSDIVEKARIFIETKNNATDPNFSL